MRFHSDIRKLGAASLLWIAFAQGVSATGVEPAKDSRVDPALCLAASSRVTTTRRSRPAAR